jgi:MraZ protein
MFIGEYSHAIDEKGRLAVPAKWRGQLAEGVIVTRGLDGCLFLYTRAAWEPLAQKLAALPVSQKQSRAFARLLLAGAWDAEIDSQGRIGLPEYLRQFAGLKKHVTVAGLYNRVEIWDEDAWQVYRTQTEAASESIAESMGELGI